MMNVVNLAERRASPQAEGDAPAVCVCGGQWFELRAPKHPRIPEHGAVVLRRDGSVSGYAGTPHCLSCGEPYYP